MERNKLNYDHKVRVATFALSVVGPYRNLSKVHEVTYELQSVKLPRSRRIIVHQNRLMKCFTRNYVKVSDMVMDAHKTVATKTQARVSEKIRKQQHSQLVICTY